jgi:hypothetical protein
MLEKAFDSRGLFQHLEWLSDLGSGVSTVMQAYTTFTSSFVLWNNLFRDPLTTAGRVGIRNAFKQYFFPSRAIRAMRAAHNYAQAARGKDMTEDVKDLVTRKILRPPVAASGMMRDLQHMKDMMEAGSALAVMFQKQGLTEKKTGLWADINSALTWPLHKLQTLFTAMEAFSKIQAYQAVIESVGKEEVARALAERAGIPKPGVGGHFSMPMEVLAPWTRVHLQGMRADFEMLRDPKKRGGFIRRMFLLEAAPRLARWAIAAGLLTGTALIKLRDDEDEDDPVLAEVMRRVSPYKMGAQNVIPFALRDSRSGEYHYFNEFKSGSAIPAHYEVVSLRLPSSEEGKLWGPLFYSMLANLGPESEKVKRAGENPISATGRWITNNMLPGVNPLIETGATLYSALLEGKNRVDSYTGRPSLNQEMFEAGGKDRLEAAAAYSLQQLGGPGTLAATVAMNMGVFDKRTSNAFANKLSTDKIPFMQRFGLTRSMVGYDNYADYRERQVSKKQEEQLRAKARLQMPERARDLYDFYWKNRDKVDEMDAVDYGRLKAASMFVSKVWGQLDDPDSFYNKMAYAATEGSKENQETARQDILMAAQPYIAMFEDPDTARFSAVLHFSDDETARVEMKAADYQAFTKKRDEVKATVIEKIRNHPQWEKLSPDDRKELELEAGQYAREAASQWILNRR